MDLHLSRSHILRYWAGTPDQHRQTNRLYRRCGLVRHSVSSLGTTGNDFWRRATLVSHARSGSAATAIRCSPRESTFGTRATMGCGGLEKLVRIRRRMGYTGPNFGRSGADQAPSFPGALHDLNGRRMRFLVPADPRSQRVLSGGPTYWSCLLYTSPSPRDRTRSRMPSSA